jgi:hypothetical protein
MALVAYTEKADDHIESDDVLDTAFAVIREAVEDTNTHFGERDGELDSNSIGIDSLFSSHNFGNSRLLNGIKRCIGANIAMHV